MKKIILFLATLTLSVSANAFDAVEYVKNSLYPTDNSRTFGMVLDNRPACREVWWESWKSDDGRDVAEYFCKYNRPTSAKYIDSPEQIEEFGEVVDAGERYRYVVGANGKVYYAGGWIWIERQDVIVKLPYSGQSFWMNKLAEKHADYTIDSAIKFLNKARGTYLENNLELYNLEGDLLVNHGYKFVTIKN